MLAIERILTSKIRNKTKWDKMNPVKISMRLYTMVDKPVNLLTLVVFNKPHVVFNTMHS